MLAAALYRACSKIGDVDYIDWNDDVVDKHYEVLVALPRSFERLVKSNRFGRTFCFPAIAEPSYTKEVLRNEARRLGCKVSDAFAPDGIYLADVLLVLGHNFVVGKYRANHSNVCELDYGMPGFKFLRKEKAKSGITTFIHVATTLGLRKGFWHVVNDFKRANLYRSRLICVGKVQNERFWIDFAKNIKAVNIEVRSFIDSASQEYNSLLREADFMFYPSLSEGQPGTVLEAMASGVIPILSQEVGIDYFPLGVYERGRSYEILKNAESMNPWVYGQHQEHMEDLVNRRFNIQVFENQVEKAILENL